MTRTRLPLLSLALLLVATGAPSWAADFAVPEGSQWTTWEAEAAAAHGSCATAADPAASGGQYVAPEKGCTLQYRFRADRATTLRLRPVWWRATARRAASLYPYPLARQFGPGAVDAYGSTVFFTAPTTGLVGRFDAAGERLLGAIEVGGYLTDLVVDPVAHAVYVADAAGDRVVVLDAATGAVRETLRTRREPWSLALVNGRLYVACRQGRALQVFDPALCRVCGTLKLDAEPVSLEAGPAAPTQLVVRFQQAAIRAQSLNPMEPDETQYGARVSRTVVSPNRDLKYEVLPAQQAIRITKGKDVIELDVKSVTAGGTTAPPPGFPADLGGPAALAQCGAKLFFTAPQTGRVGVFDTTTDKLVGTIEVGGWLADLVARPKTDRVYVADATGGRVVVLDAAKLAVAGEIKVAAQPVTLDLAEGFEVQRPGMLPPTAINRLFAACAGGQALAVVDLATERLLDTVPLGRAARAARLVPPPASGWWPTLADDRIAFAMTPRVAVEPMPLTISLPGLSVAPAPLVAEAAPRRASVKLALGGAEKTVAAGTPLLLQVDGKRWVDVSEVCDPQLQPQRPLTEDDRAGSLTVAMDGGPEYDWRRGIWSRPDNNAFLVYDTDEYWRWNAPAFRLSPGEHTLTLRATDPEVRLDAVLVLPTAEGTLDMTVRPEPWETHGAVPSASYQGVFYDQEPAQFRVTVTNRGDRAASVEITGALANYLGETAPAGPPLQLTVPARGQAGAPLRLAPADTGRFTLTLSLRGQAGELVRDVRFVRLPKLTHPRLFFRADDLAQIKERLAKHPRLYARYADWLTRMSAKEGRYPERFLPNGLTAAELASMAPPGAVQAQQAYGWRMYELAWRMMAAQFAARYIPGADTAALDARLKPLLEAPRTDTWIHYHHHGPFFPGAVEGLVDMAPETTRQALPLTSFFAKYKGDINLFPFALMALEEPLSPADRALVYEMAMMQNNFQRYFETHAGVRGGTWWQNPWSGCYCPTQAIFLGFLFTKNVLGEPRLFEAPFFRGYLTFMEFADPITDPGRLLPALRRPSGEPWRWALGAVSRHPLEKGEYAFDDWVRKLDGDLPQPEAQAVDDLMALKGHPLAGPFTAAPHSFNTAVAIPVALALGWYDPDAPTVTWDDLPPSTLFDVEGWATLRSGWDPDATEVTFMSGIRDHTTRHQPNHFTLVRAGQYLLGTPSVWGDDGNCIPAWGNTVVVGDRWLDRWQMNLHPARSLDRALIDRFTPENWAYIARDRARFGYAPAESGWGGGINLHGHTETLLIDEGRTLAYETSPEFDYVAGEAAGAFPPAELRSHTRQLVFLKPNVVVVYDRVQLGPAATTSKWLATTGPDLTLDGPRFTVKAGEARLAGQVLLPAGARLSPLDPLPIGFLWKTQKALQVQPAQDAPTMEYLVALTTGRGQVTPAQTSVLETAETLGVAVTVDGRRYDLTLRRQGPLGGAIRFSQGGVAVDRPLATKVEDTYARWKSDPRFAQWTTEPRFDFIIPPGDRVR